MFPQYASTGDKLYSILSVKCATGGIGKLFIHALFILQKWLLET